MTCRFKNVFGVPREGIHSIRLFDIAVVDVLGTVLLAFLLSKIFQCNFLLTFTALLILSVFVHKLFCVDTTLTKKVFK